MKILTLALISICAAFAILASDKPEPVKPAYGTVRHVNKIFYRADYIKLDVDLVETVKHNENYVWPLEGLKIRKVRKDYAVFSSATEAWKSLESRLLDEKKYAVRRFLKAQEQLNKLEQLDK